MSSVIGVESADLDKLERVTRLAHTLASEVPTTAAVHTHISDAYTALQHIRAARQPYEALRELVDLMFCTHATGCPCLVCNARASLAAFESLEPIAYLRDLDGTGSFHVCAAGDFDAIPVYSFKVEQ